MIEIPAGTLVRVRPSATTPRFEYYRTNREVVAEGGWLWFVEGPDKDVEHLYVCRSLATGRESDWYDYEIEMESSDVR